MTEPSSQAAEHAQVRVTCTDLASSESDSQEITDNYVLVTAGSCDVTYVSTTACKDGTETHVITVKGARRG